MKFNYFAVVFKGYTGFCGYTTITRKGLFSCRLTELNKVSKLYDTMRQV